MMKKVTGNRLQLTVFFIIAASLLFLLYPTTYNLKPTFAQSAPCPPGTTPRAGGLITTPELSGKFGTTANNGACIKNQDRAAFVSFKLPGFEDLKSIYYTQSKATKQEVSSMPTIADQRVYLRTGDMTISSDPTGAGTATALVFVDRNLNITSNITYGSPTTGLVFVVGGNVVIESAVTRIDAVIISGGYIYTSGSGCSFSASSPITSQLIVNGNLVSLNLERPIKFCRSLADNSIPAEKINHQPKYLVILKDIFSETLQKWSEVSGDFQLPEDIPLSPVVDIQVNGGNGPVTIAHNTSANLTWNVTNSPTSCTAGGSWSGGRPASGSQPTGNLTGPGSYTYSLQCNNARGTHQDSVTVNVSAPPVIIPTVDIFANGSNGPLNLSHNSSANLSWITANNPTSCNASGSWSGAKATAGGSQSTGTLAGPNSYTYTLSCSNSAGTRSDNVTVNVSSPPGPANLLANPGFESQLTGWGYYSSSGIAVFNADSTSPKSGSFSGRIDNTSGWAWGAKYVQTISADPQERFCISGWVKKHWNDGGNTWIGIQENTSPWRSSNIKLNDNGSPGSVYNQWVFLRGTIQHSWSNSTQNVEVELRTVYNDEVWFDDVSISRGACS